MLRGANSSSDGFYLSGGFNNTLLDNYVTYNKYDDNVRNSLTIGFHIIHITEQYYGGNYIGTLLGNTVESQMLASYRYYIYKGFLIQGCGYTIVSGNTAIETYNGFYIINNYKYYSEINTLITDNIAITCFRGFFLENSKFVDIIENSALDCIRGYELDGPSYHYSNDLTGSIWMNYMRVQIKDDQGIPVPDAEVMIKTDGVVKYATPMFGGSDPLTNHNGLIPWLLVAYKTGTTYNEDFFIININRN